jgi:hypothetical protein
MSYRNLEIWQEAKDVSLLVHEMTLKLPRFEQFEEGQQIIKSVKRGKPHMMKPSII